MTLQTMEPSAEQLRIASLLEDKSSNTDLENKIQKVIEFTGCNSDQAAVALYDTDYNIELACLKVLEAGDTGDTGDSWATVEKPQKKVEREEKPLVMEKFERSSSEQSNRGGRGGGRGGGTFRERGRGDFRGRGGRGRGGSNYGGNDRDRFDQFNNQFGGQRGGRGRGGFRGGRGGGQGGRGRSEIQRGRPQQPRPSRNRDFARRGNSPAASESGSDDWGGNKGGNERQWDNQNWESTEFKKSGWDEPDSIERFSQQKDKKREPRKHSEGEQWDAPRQSGRQMGKVERWQQQNDSSWNEEDSWDNKKNDGWKEAREWDAGEANQSNTWEESKSSEEHKNPIQHWSNETPPKESAPEAQLAPATSELRQTDVADSERKERLAKIFNKSVNISTSNERITENNIESNSALSSAAIKSRLGIQESKPVAPAQNSNVGPPGFSKPEQILSFGRSPEDAGRRMPPPVRSVIPKSVLQMPSEHDHEPQKSQFCFGSFDETPTVPPPQQQQPVQQHIPQQVQKPVQSAPSISSRSTESASQSASAHDNYQARMFPSSNVSQMSSNVTQMSSNVAPPVKSENLSPPALKPLQTRYSPQNLHSQATQRNATATKQNTEQNKDLQDHGLYNKDYLTSREKAEKDLRNLLKQNPSSKPNTSSMTSSTGTSGSTGGVVPGLINPPISRHSPQQDHNVNQSGINSSGVGNSSVMNSSVINSAPGQGRSSMTRQQQYQPTISAVDSVGMHAQSYNPMPGYDLMLQRPTIQRPSEDMRQTQSGMNSYQTPYQPIQSFYNIPTIPYYPVQLNQRQSSSFPQMTSYQGQVGQTTTSDSMRNGMRGAPQEMNTPPPFQGLSPHTGYTQHQPGVFTNPILIPQNGPGMGQQSMNMSHHQQDNRGPR